MYARSGGQCELIGVLEVPIMEGVHILYQIALQVLTQEEWKDVKKQADKIGYCCFEPEDQE